MIRRNTKIDPDKLLKTGVYTAYKSNRLNQTLSVSEIDKGIVQYMIEEGAQDIKVSRREKKSDTTDWTDWKEYIEK